MKVKSHNFRQKKAGREGKRVSPGGVVLDRFLIPRIRSYAENNPIDDIDEVVEKMRAMYRDYQRQKVKVFHMQVARAISAVQNEQGQSSEDIMEDMEEREMPKNEAGASLPVTKGRPSHGLFAKSDGEGDEGDSTSSSLSSDSSNEDDSSDDSSEADLEEEAAAHKSAGGGLNASLLSMYSRNGGEDKSNLEPISQNEEEGDRMDSRKGDPPPFPYKGAAFAPPDVIAAAAARALAEERAEKEAKKGILLPFSQPIKVMSGKPVLELIPQQGVPPSNPLKRPREAAPADSHHQDEPKPIKTLGSNPPVKKKARKGSRVGMESGGGGGLGSGGSALTLAKPLTYSDLGGIDDVLADIKELIEYPLKHPEVYAWLGVEPPRGVLLHGPPGCGKTALAHAIANECQVPFLRVSAPEVVSGMSGESEAKLRALFQEATDLAPCIVFIDEIDAIFPKRDQAQREMERRIVAQMLTCMDDLSSIPPSATDNKQRIEEEGDLSDSNAVKSSHPHVIVIGATNRPDAMDPALRRAGRFDREISLGIPTEAGRMRILQVISRKLRLEGNFDFMRVAKMTPGFVGADLTALCKEAAAIAVTRIFQHTSSSSDKSEAIHSNSGLSSLPHHASLSLLSNPLPNVLSIGLPPERFGAGPLTLPELQGLAITMNDFDSAVHKVQPSIRREGFATTPDVTWEDVGSLDEIKEELSFSITQPIRHPERFEAMGLPSAAGVLLYGPPGCGKTLVAKAVAADASANFISIKGPELLNKYVGESEKAVRQLFSRARAAKPCVLFFDEMDALAPRRGGDSSNQAAERLVNQLLTEMDGVESRSGVYLIAATNRPDMIDPALLRPGRLEKILYVPLPPPDGRVSVLRALTRRSPLHSSVDIEVIGRSDKCDGFSGADMAALVREASVIALKESLETHPLETAMESSSETSHPLAVKPVSLVFPRHFDAAMDRVLPSVSKRDVKMYDQIRVQLGRARVAPVVDKKAQDEKNAEGSNNDEKMILGGGIHGLGGAR